MATDVATVRQHDHGATAVLRRRAVPLMTVRRLSTYYRLLGALEAQGDPAPIGSEQLAEPAGVTAAQVRRDLTYFGTFGRRGVGYEVAALRRSLARVLGVDRTWRVGLVGVGNLGRALLRYPGFAAQGLHIMAAFDADPRQIGRRYGRVLVRSPAELSEAVRQEALAMAIIAVPAAAAQPVADALVRAGIRAILNFAPVKLVVPPEVHLVQIDLAIELEYLSYLLTHQA